MSSRKEDEEKRESEYEAMKAKVMDALKKTFRPEFINRLDGIMVFRSLSRDEIAQIVELELRPLRMQMAEQEMKLELTDAARMAVADAGYDPDYGARPLRRVIQNQIQDPLSEGMLAEKYVAWRHHHGGLSRGASRRTAPRPRSSCSTSPTTSRSKRPTRQPTSSRRCCSRNASPHNRRNHAVRRRVRTSSCKPGRPCLALPQPGRIIGGWAIITEGIRMTTRCRGEGGAHRVYWPGHYGPWHGSQPAEGRLCRDRVEPHHHTDGRTRGAGGPCWRSPADVAERSDIVVTCVSDTPDVEAVVLGENGIIQGAQPGSFVIDCSTISPQATQLAASSCPKQHLYAGRAGERWE